MRVLGDDRVRRKPGRGHGPYARIHGTRASAAERYWSVFQAVSPVGVIPSATSAFSPRVSLGAANGESRAARPIVRAVCRPGSGVQATNAFKTRQRGLDNTAPRVSPRSLLIHPTMKISRISAMLPLLLLGACETETPSAPTGPAASARFDRATPDVNIHVDGEGSAPLPGGNGPIVYSIKVRQNPVGHASGEFHQYRVRANGLTVDFTGETMCLAIDEANHRVWIAGTITTNNSTDPVFQQSIHQPGQDIWFRVVDNETASPVAADRLTVFGFAGSGGIQTSAEYCQMKLWAAGDANTFAVVDGNIRVKPH